MSSEEVDHHSGLNYQDLITVDFNLLMLLIVFIDGDLWPFMHCGQASNLEVLSSEEFGSLEVLIWNKELSAEIRFAEEENSVFSL